jgi:hypothetical protein
MRQLPLEEDVTRTMARSVSAMTKELLGGGGQREVKVVYVIVMMPLIR